MGILGKVENRKQELHLKPFHGSGNYTTNKWENNHVKVRVQSIPVMVNVERIKHNWQTKEIEKYTAREVRYIYQYHREYRINQ